MAWEIIAAAFAGGLLSLAGVASEGVFARRSEQRERLQTRLDAVMAWTAPVEVYVNLIRQRSTNRLLLERVEQQKHRADAQWDSAQLSLIWLGTSRHPVGSALGITAWQVYALLQALPTLIEVHARAPRQVSWSDVEHAIDGAMQGLVVLRTQIQGYWDEMDRPHPLLSMRRWRLHRSLRNARRDRLAQRREEVAPPVDGP